MKIVPNSFYRGKLKGNLGKYNSNQKYENEKMRPHESLSTKNPPKTESVIQSIDGILVNFCGDDGPIPIHNNSSLTEEQAQKLCVIGTTMLSVGVNSYHSELARLYGPLPVPVPNLEAIAIAFRVKVLHSKDNRILRNGSVANIWIIFNSRYRDLILFHFFDLEYNLKELIFTIEYSFSLLDPDLITKILMTLRS